MATWAIRGGWGAAGTSKAGLEATRVAIDIKGHTRAGIGGC